VFIIFCASAEGSSTETALADEKESSPRKFKGALFSLLVGQNLFNLYILLELKEKKYDFCCLV